MDIVHGCSGVAHPHHMKQDFFSLRILHENSLCTSQLKPPPFGSRGRVGDLTLTPVKRHQYPYPLRL